jgi:hypothetical protein
MPLWFFSFIVSYAPVYHITAIVTTVGPAWQFSAWVGCDSVTCPFSLKNYPAGRDHNNLLPTAVLALCNFTLANYQQLKHLEMDQYIIRNNFNSQI